MESDGIIDGNEGVLIPVTVMPLTNLKVDKAKPKEKQYKLADDLLELQRLFDRLVLKLKAANYLIPEGLDS